MKSCFDEETKMDNMLRSMEIDRPQTVPCPYEDKYTTDVLVIGCGFAGLNAAVSAREKGLEVLVVDKGKPGYSGLSPWPSSFRWFDPERDDPDAFRAAICKGGDYLSNMNWFNVWIKESAEIKKRLTEWGILAQYPNASEAGDFYAKEDFVGYRETFDKFDRHKKWIQVLKRYDIPYLERTMVCQLLTHGDQVIGAVAMHVQSGVLIVIRAKAVVLATGNGCYRPTGYPLGTDTFDGEYMAYQLGLPIAGKEFEDFHQTPSSAPGNVFLDNHWQYLENIWLCGGDITKENADTYAASKGNIMMMSRARSAVYGPKVASGMETQDVAKANFTRRGGSCHYETDPGDIRSGKMSTPTVASQLPGAAVGMSCHLTGGVFCGLDNMDCSTDVKGLYVAGDGTHSTSPSGAAYPCGVGFTSCFCSIDGAHAGRAAAGFAAGNTLEEVSEEQLKAVKAEILAPLSAEKGFDPNWARDVLQSIMAPYWVNIAKTEETLSAALTQVRYMKKHVVPHLAARTSHDLRLCMEMKHKVLSAEMKLTASLAREESRGAHYREDIPYRNDDFLCYITLRKDKTGAMKIEKIPVPRDWTGPQGIPYEQRYQFYFPGEPEAKGFTPPDNKDGKGRAKK